MILSEDHRDLICAFNDEDVRYLVVGAYAMTAHGFPRATGDIDLWIERSPSNAAAVIRALNEFGAPFDLSEEELQKKEMVFYMGRPPERIDIITDVSGLEFEEAYRNSLRGVFGGMEVRVLSVEDLIKNKRASGRLKDLADVERLERGRPDADD